MRDDSGTIQSVARVWLVRESFGREFLDTTGLRPTAPCVVEADQRRSHPTLARSRWRPHLAVLGSRLNDPSDEQWRARAVPNREEEGPVESQ